MSTAEEVAMLEHQIATVLDDMRTEWIEGLLPKLAEFVEGREQAAYRRALEDAAEVVKSRFEHGRLTTDECELVETWLRDRAGVGTKDGDDDE